MSRHLQSTSKLLEAALPNSNNNNRETPSMPGENVAANPVKWIRGQNVQLNCDEEEDNQKQRKPCFFSLNHQNRKPCATTLVFSSSTSTPQEQVPHLGLYYQLNSLDSNHHLRDFVESDILISKKFSASSSTTNPTSHLLHHIDCQVVFDTNLLPNQESEKQHEQEKASSGNAFLLHVVEFCPGGSLLNLVQDRLKVVESRKLQRQEATLSSASNHNHSNNNNNNSNNNILDSLLLPLSSVTRIVYELLKAVHHLHKNLKIVHNAINLHNVFLDSENHVRLGNFSHSFSTTPATTTTPAIGIDSKNNKNPLDERKINNNFSSSSSSRQPRSASANKNIINNTPSRSRSASKMSSPSRGKSPTQRSCSSPRSCSPSPAATTRFCDFCIHKLPEDEFATRNMNSENDETPLLIKNHIKESRDVFSIGVVCYQLLFGTSPPLKSIKNKPETSLAMKLISLREELILSFSDSCNNNSRENTSMMMVERKKRQEETLLMHNELLCRFLLLSLSILPLDRPRISDCLSMFDNAFVTLV